MHNTVPLDDIALIPQPMLCAMLGRTPSGLRKLRENDPDFPVPHKYGSSRQARCYYVASEVNEWLTLQVAKRVKA